MVISIFIFITKGSSKNNVNGFYWEAKKDNKSIYLIGTVHLGEKRLNYLNNNLNYILNNTQALATETNSKDIDPEYIKKLQDKIYLTSGELKDFLNKEEQNQLKDILKYLDLKYDDVSNLSKVGLNALIQNYIDSIDGFEDEGLDAYLENLYRKSKKDSISLETLDDTSYNINYMLDEFLDVDYIKNELKDRKDFMNAFINGDTLFFKSHLENGKDELDMNAYTKIVKDRNENMANRINSLLKENKTYAVAIGVGHFFGDDTVITYLENLGYSITKLNK
ncbi:TraB/GumN family protein [Paeniclostridium sp. NSJ-45]|uniref:TraB/GumN family protein n=1 Tax=Paeniclostridium hominis TaxID=2764329 RepID=A0ABR7K793_9FIRM|nr:TraB/GumN family protein [Paeniclostridium hominis]MBC6004911.1 TraB/GumN family protein [Paeniclostridium hominis]